jgi:hypothetical protein
MYVYAEVSVRLTKQPTQTLNTNFQAPFHPMTRTDSPLLGHFVSVVLHSRKRKYDMAGLRNFGTEAEVFHHLPRASLTTMSRLWGVL